MFIQQVKQAVPPDIQHLIGLAVEQIVQFTRTDAWLTAPDTSNKIKNLRIMFLSFIFTLRCPDTTPVCGVPGTGMRG